MGFTVTVGKNKREIRNPIAKVVIGVPLIAFGMVMLVVGMIVLAVVIVVGAPLWVPLHFVLRAFGRRGFVTTHDGLKINLSHEGFYRA